MKTTVAVMAPTNPRTSALWRNVKAMGIVWYREILRYLRDWVRIITSLVQPLLTTLMAGGLGYAMGSSSAQQNAPQYPPYPPQPYPYQAPPAAPQGPVSGADSGKLAQLQLLGELHESGVLTDDEFEREKQRILRG